jgi:hypothetical protein
MRSAKRFLIGLMALGVTLGTASAAHAQDEVNLQYNYKKGDVFRYKLDVIANVMGMEVTVKTGQKMTVKEVKENGDFVIVYEGEAGVANIGGQEQEMPAQPPFEITISKRGKFVSYNSEAQQGLMSPEIVKLMAVMNENVLPDKAVKAGDTWTTEVDNPAVKNQKVVTKTTFVGIEKVDEVEYWKIKQVSEAATDDSGTKMTQEMTVWLVPGSGHTYKMEGKIKGLPTQFGDMDWTIKMSLVKDK